MFTKLINQKEAFTLTKSELIEHADVIYSNLNLYKTTDEFLLKTLIVAIENHLKNDDFCKMLSLGELELTKFYLLNKITDSVDDILLDMFLDMADINNRLKTMSPPKISFPNMGENE